jgi:opacity protein-like surface antigen
MGFATGWRLGVESPHLFIDGEFSYIRNKFNSLSNGLVSFTGEVEKFGFLINAGAKARIFSKASMFIGAGFGAMNQEIGFDLNSMIIGEEESTLFSYQLFSGIDFIMTEHLRLGLRYRWIRIGEMELFTSRDLHLAELSLGYVF